MELSSVGRAFSLILLRVLDDAGYLFSPIGLSRLAYGPDRRAYQACSTYSI